MSTARTIKRNGGVLVPRNAIPTRDYPDTWSEVWKAAAKIDGKHGYAVDLAKCGATVNALRCALGRAKRKGRVPKDLRVRDSGQMAYLYRKSSNP